MIKMKKVSVVMGVYNEEEHWLKQTINSILGQSYKNIEFIIILDNPNNVALKKLLNSYQNKIKFYINSTNLGLVRTLNKGIKLATGEYIARMDADDIASENRIEKQVEFLEKNHEYIMVGSRVTYINELDEELDISDKRYLSFEDIKKTIMYRNEFVHPSMLMRRREVLELGLYKDAEFAEDYELVFNMLVNNYKVANLEEKLLKYRMRENGISMSKRIFQITTTIYLQQIYQSYLKTGKYKFDKLELKEIHKRDINEKFKKNTLDKIDKCMSKFKKAILILILSIISCKYRKWYYSKMKIKILQYRLR